MPANPLSAQQASDIRAQLQRLADAYLANMDARSLTRDAAPLAEAKRRLLRTLTTIPATGALVTREELLERIQLINRLVANIDAKNPVPLNEFLLDGRDTVTINKSSFISRLIQSLFSWIMTPNLHFDDTLKAAETILRGALESCPTETEIYTGAETSDPPIPHEKFAEGNPDPATVMEDLARDTRLVGYETRARKPAGITRAIRGFSEGSPAVHKIIREIPAQSVFMPLEAEILKLFQGQGCLPNFRKIPSKTFRREGDKVIFNGSYEVRSITDIRGSEVELVDENGNGDFQLRPVRHSPDGRAIYSDRALPIFRAELEVEFSIATVTEGEETRDVVSSHLRSLKMSSYTDAIKLGTVPEAPAMTEGEAPAATPDAAHTTTTSEKAKSTPGLASPHWTHAAAAHADREYKTEFKAGDGGYEDSAFEFDDDATQAAVDRDLDNLAAIDEDDEHDTREIEGPR